MKRTQNIRKSRFRKRILFPGTSLLCLGALAAPLFLTGCDVSDDTYRPYGSIAECQKNLNDYSDKCRDAYSQAVDNAKVSGKTYRTKEECEQDNRDQGTTVDCQYTPHGSTAHYFPYPHYFSYAPGHSSQAFYRSKASNRFYAPSGKVFEGRSSGVAIRRGGFGSTAHSFSSHSSGG